MEKKSKEIPSLEEERARRIKEAEKFDEEAIKAEILSKPDYKEKKQKARENRKKIHELSEKIKQDEKDMQILENEREKIDSPNS